jgi:hypothetical protein
MRSATIAREYLLACRLGESHEDCARDQVSRFATEVLGFERKWPGHEDREMANGVIDLVRDGVDLQLSRHSGDGVFGSVNRVFVDDAISTYLHKQLDSHSQPEIPARNY